jgi:PST family polysaccharide transporter
MNLRQKTIRGMFWSAAQSWGGHLITLLVFAVLARMLDPSAFGLVALANVFVAFVKVFSDQGFTLAIVQRRNLEQAHLSTAFWTNISIGIALMCFGVVTSDFTARLLGEPGLAPIIRWMSIIFLISSLNGVQQALLQRNLEFKKLAIRSLSATVAGGIVGIVLALRGFGVWSLVWQQLTGSIVQVIVLWRVGRWRPTLEFSIPHFKDLFAYGANVVGIKLMEFFNRNADNFLIGYFLGAVALGYYTVAYKLFQTLTKLFTAVTSLVTISSFSALQEDIPRLRNAFYAATQYTSVITIPLFVGLIVLGQQLTVLLFGQQWQASVPVVQILALAGILESIYFYNANVMLAMGKPSWRLKLNILSAIVNVIGFLIAVQWGIAAVAAAYVIRGYLLSPLPLILVRKLIDINIRQYLFNFLVPVAATGAMVIALLVIKPMLSGTLDLFPLTAICVTSGAIIYAAIAYLLSPALFLRMLNVVRR